MVARRIRERARRVSDEEFYRRVQEHRKDPNFMKALREFIQANE